MFDECAGNFTHKRLKAVLWLLAVVAFFAAFQLYHVCFLKKNQVVVSSSSSVTNSVSPVSVR